MSNSSSGICETPATLNGFFQPSHHQLMTNNTSSNNGLNNSSGGNNSASSNAFIQSIQQIKQQPHTPAPSPLPSQIQNANNNNDLINGQNCNTNNPISLVSALSAAFNNSSSGLMSQQSIHLNNSTSSISQNLNQSSPKSESLIKYSSNIHHGNTSMPDSPSSNLNNSQNSQSNEVNKFQRPTSNLRSTATPSPPLNNSTTSSNPAIHLQQFLINSNQQQKLNPSSSSAATLSTNSMSISSTNSTNTTSDENLLNSLGSVSNTVSNTSSSPSSQALNIHIPTSSPQTTTSLKSRDINHLSPITNSNKRPRLQLEDDSPNWVLSNTSS